MWLLVSSWCSPLHTLLADIGAGLGYIWGGFAFSTSTWAWFFMPELKVTSIVESRLKISRTWDELSSGQGRKLEEIDQLFEAEIPTWQFHKFQTDGLSHDLAVLEGGKTDAKVVDQFEDVERAVPEAAPVSYIR